MRLVVLLLLALVAFAVRAAAEEEPKSGIPYTVSFEGLDQVHELEDLVRESSALVSKSGDPPASRAALHRRADADVERFLTAAKSLGYYDAEFEVEIAPVTADGTPVVVRIKADPGTVYTLSALEIRSTDDGSSAIGVELSRDRLAFAVGDQARAADVVASEAAVLRMLHERGHPLAVVGERRVVIDRDKKTMQVTYRVDPGPKARFGPVSVSGAETVDPTFILRRLPWRFGEEADVRKMEEGRRALAATGVFETAGIKFADKVDGEGLLPVEVSVTERAPRSIGAGLSVSTSEGFGANAFWTHRNLFGGAERLDINARVSQVENSLTGELRLPDVFYNDQDLIFSSGLIQETTDSYDSEKISFGSRFERRISEILTVDYGVSLERSRIEESGETNRYTLVGLPVGAAIDTSDDLLNPTRGGRTRVRFTPYLESLGSTLGFYSITARHSHYAALDEARDLILAGRAAIGSTVGGSTGNIPADKRFYSGGSGSVRGYGLQKVGPLDAGGEPEGGRSLFEVGLELRWRVFGDFGIVPFIDGGQVYDDETPDFSQDLLWAAGLGFRYFTPIGPIRADIAFPLNPRDSDDRFQVYFSLGQAF